MQQNSKRPRILVISPAGQVYNHDRVRWYKQSQQEIEERYFNIGDMVVYDSTLKMLDFAEISDLKIVSPTAEDIERYKGFDYIFVRASNFIHNEMQWHRALEVLEQVRLPVYALGVGGGTEAAADGVAEGERAAGGDRLAVEEGAVVAGLRFERVAEGVAEVEERADAGRLVLVGGDDPRL